VGGYKPSRNPIRKASLRLNQVSVRCQFNCKRKLDAVICYVFICSKVAQPSCFLSLNESVQHPWQFPLTFAAIRSDGHFCQLLQNLATRICPECKRCTNPSFVNWTHFGSWQLVYFKLAFVTGHCKSRTFLFNICMYMVFSPIRLLLWIVARSGPSFPSN